MSNTTAYKHIDPTTPDRLVHSSLLGKLFAEITIANCYDPKNEAVARLYDICNEMRHELKAWGSKADEAFAHKENTRLDAVDKRVADEIASRTAFQGEV